MLNFKLLLSALICLSLTACTTNTASTPSKGNIQKVEQGTITQIKKVATTNNSNPLGSSIGMNVGSGGAGIYGAVDVTKIFAAMTKPTHQLELIVKKHNGELVAITQSLGGNFKVGDKVKILLRNGLAVVQH